MAVTENPKENWRDWGPSMTFATQKKSFLLSGDSIWESETFLHQKIYAFQKNIKSIGKATLDALFGFDYLAVTYKQRKMQNNLKVWWYTGSHPEVQGNFIENALRHGCSPVNLLHILRTPLLNNASGWLLLMVLILAPKKLTAVEFLDKFSDCLVI